MLYRVTFDPAAQDDLDEIAGWIAERASVAVAIGYVGRILDVCRRLDVFPRRGTMRDDLYPGLRTLGFERRAVIAFLVGQEDVHILRILYGGQDVERALGRLR